MWLWPVGDTIEERTSAIPWGPLWTAALSYGQWYLLRGLYPAIHTGADLVLMQGNSYGHGVFAPSAGLVTFSRDVTTSTWRNLVVIEHTEDDGSLTYTRYGHLARRDVIVGQKVARGDQIGAVGSADGVFPPHLHYDCSRANILKLQPTNWPGDDIATVRKLYTDPLAWTVNSREDVSPMASFDDLRAAVRAGRANLDNMDALIDQLAAGGGSADVQATVVSLELNVRKTAALAGVQMAVLHKGDVIRVLPAGTTADGHVWVAITALVKGTPTYAPGYTSIISGYVARDLLSFP